MAFNAPMSFLLAVLSLFAAANLAHAQVLFPPIFPIPPITPPTTVPPNISLVTINGTLCCTPTGACPGTPLVNQTVSLVCPALTGGNITLAVAITNSNGTFTITITDLIRFLPYLLNGLRGCKVTVNLPVSPLVCPVLSTTGGILSATLSFLGAFIDALGRFVLSFLTPNFSITN